MSLRKKLFDHKETAGHKSALKVLDEAKNKTIENAFLNVLSHEKVITAKIFCTAYKVAKENQSFNNLEFEINLQELNVIDMGRILHSTNACINIVNHVSLEMKKILISKILKSKNKFSLITDEPTTMSKKSTLIVYIRICVPEKGMNSHVNLFLDLIELENVTARGIFNSLLECLKSYGMTEDYLKNYLVCVACDGAAVMLGGKSGVKKLVKNKLPSVIVWHHRLELSVSDTVKEIASVNRFKKFIDKLYVLYHSSPKKSRELKVCANLLEIQLLKIGRILGTRWVASSFRSVTAVWENYEALVQHFEEAKNDSSREKKDQCAYEGLKRKITSVEFILDLGLMCDALQELSELSLDLQERDIDLYKANQKIKALVQIFEERRIVSGPYYEKATKAAENLCFKGVALHRKDHKGDPTIEPDAFYKTIKKSIEERLLDTEDADIVQCTRVFDEKQWPENVEAHLTFGEREIRILSLKFLLNERDTIRAFRQYLNEKKIPEKIQLLKLALTSIPISSSECERGFSQMNLIVSPTRCSILTKTVSALLFIKIVGPPLFHFDPNKYVESWLLPKRH